MADIDSAAKRLEEALAQLEAEVKIRLESEPPAKAALAEVAAERDALRAAVDAASVRVDRTIATVRALLDDGDNSDG